MTAAEITTLPGPLDGLRVLDVAEPYGAYVSRILGDLGADVLKLEPPGGDRGRDLLPLLASAHGKLSLPFVHANVNKRSLTLDLQRPEGQTQFYAMAQDADVVVSTEGRQAWAQRGLDLQHLEQTFPRLIWTAFTSFGLSGPHSEYLGNNLIAEAMGGLMYIQGDDALPPCVSPYAQGSHLASLHAVFGTLLALRERQVSGCGQLVEVAIQEVLAHVYYPTVRYAYTHDILRRTGARNPQPANGYYHCQDGQVFLCVFQANHWTRLVEGMEDPVLADPAFLDRDYRQAHAELIETRLQAWTRRFTRWDLTEALQRLGLPVAPLLTVADLARNPHLETRQFFTTLVQPPWDSLRTTGPLYRTSGPPLRVWRPAPAPGTPPETASPTLPCPSAANHPGPRRLPLAGVRVLDLSRVWAGPYGTRYLADYGAEVLKVESGKFPDGRRPNDAAFAEINRNKHFITLNFQVPEGRELLLRLVAISDVVVENFSPRVMAKYELDYHHLRAVRPDLIMASMPGFGQHGPHSAFVSYGGPLMAYTGMALLWGHPDAPLEAHSKIAYPDYIAAGTLALAVLAALQHRARTGEGQSIEIAQVEATATAMEVAFLDYFARGVVAQPQGNRDPNYAPQGCYPCLGHDAWCAISCMTEAQWHALARLIGGTALAEAPEYATAEARWRHHDALDACIGAWTRQHTPHAAMRLLQAAGVPAGAVQSAEDLWRDVHLRARDYYTTLQHPDYGKVEHPSRTVHLHGTAERIVRPAGRLGEANRAVFQGLLGLSDDALAHYVAAGVMA